MVRLAAKKSGIKPIPLKSQPAYSGTRSLNPKKLMQNWQKLSASHVYEYCLMTPIHMHNALCQHLNERRK